MDSDRFSRQLASMTGFTAVFLALLSYPVAGLATGAEPPDIERIPVVGARPRVDGVGAVSTTISRGGYLPPVIERFQVVGFRLRQDRLINANTVIVDGLNPDPNHESHCALGGFPAQAGNPVVIATGNKIETETDFVGGGEAALSLRREYNAYWRGVGVFGKQWVSNYDYALTFGTTALNACFPRPGGGTCGIGSNTVIYAWRPDGRTLKFTRNAADGVFYENRPSPIAKIVVQPDGRFVLTTDQNEVETYSSAGYISDVKNEHGIGWNYSYAGTYPVRVTHTSGRYVEFTWSGGKLSAVRDPAGNQYNYAYHADRFGAGLHLLSSTQRPGTPTTHIAYHYEDSRFPGALTGKSYGGVRYSYFAYTANMKVESTEHGAGRDRHSFLYYASEPGHWYVDITNPLSLKTSHSVRNDKTESIDRWASPNCGAATKLTTLDQNGYPDIYTDFNGNITDFDYNAKGQLVREREAMGTPLERVTEYVWDTAANRVMSVVLLGQYRTDYVYDADRRIASVTQTNLSANGVQGQSRTTTYAYTKHGNGMLATMLIDGPLAGAGDAITIAYSASGDALSATNSVGHVLRYENHNGLGQPGRAIGINGETTDFIYDGQGRVLTERRWIAGVAADTQYAYNAQDLPVSETRADGSATYYEYDSARRLTRVWRAANGTVAGGASKEDMLFSYDAMGNLIRYDKRKLVGHFETQCRRWVTIEGQPECVDEVQAWVEVPTIVETGLTDYDELGRVRASRGNNGQITRYAYDDNGNLRTTTDTLGRVTTLHYDALDRVSMQVDAAGGATRLEYDAADRPIKVTDARGLHTTYVFDGFGQLWAQNSPDTGITSFQYDASGLRTLATRNDGTTLSYVYDNLGRLIWYGTSSQGRGFGYDGCTNGKGRLCTADYSSGTKHFVYTPEGWLQGALDWSPATGSDYTAYTYDALGRVTGIAYPSGVSVGYGYSNGKLTTMLATLPNGTTQMVAGTINYRPFGGIDNWTYGNNLQRNYAHDLDGRLTGIANGGVQRLSYAHNDIDEIVRIVDEIDPAQSQDYAYDALSRLSAQSMPAATLSFVYDAIGNRTSRSDNGIATQYAYAAGSHRLQSAVSPGLNRSFNTNAVGNIEGWHDAAGVYGTLSYDAYLRPSRHVRQGAATDYVFNALDQRVSKTRANGDRTVFVYAGQNTLLAERFNEAATGAVSWTSHLWLGGHPVGLVRGNTLYWVHADHIGRPQVVSNAAQQPVWRASNRAFERDVVLNQIGGYNLGYPGQYWDAESGLWHNGFRDYEPTLGRYLQSDPIGLMGGSSTYAYVLGNPVMAMDSLGLKTCLLTTVGLGGVRDHAAVYTSRGDGSGGPALYDPAGSYGAANGGGSGGIVEGDAASIEKFVRYHESQKTEVNCKETSQEEEESIINSAMNLPSADPFECAEMSSAALSGKPSFPYVEAGTFWPGDLLRQVLRRGP